MPSKTTRNRAAQATLTDTPGNESPRQGDYAGLGKFPNINGVLGGVNPPQSNRLGRFPSAKHLTQNSAAVSHNCVCRPAIENGLDRIRAMPCRSASARTVSAGWAVIRTQLQQCTARMAS